MRLTIDHEKQTISCEDGGSSQSYPLYSDEAFELLSREWVRVGWNQRYTYTFSWFGRPVIQLPEDMIRAQEVIHRVRPDLIVETGVAHGGSLIYYASLCKAMGRGRVAGIDVEIRPENRLAITEHEFAGLISLIEGSSTDDAVVSQVRALAADAESVLLFLDSDHSYDHVMAELEAYHSLVTPGSYIVATDGVMKDLTDVPRGDRGWGADNPADAAREFAGSHPEFVIEQPPWPFNESSLSRGVTHWPGAWLRRR
jgi:cephalosporin hydroxylase